MSIFYIISQHSVKAFQEEPTVEVIKKLRKNKDHPNAIQIFSKSTYWGTIAYWKRHLSGSPAFIPWFERLFSGVILASLISHLSPPPPRCSCLPEHLHGDLPAWMKRSDEPKEGKVFSKSETGSAKASSWHFHP